MTIPRSSGIIVARYIDHPTHRLCLQACMAALLVATVTQRVLLSTAPEFYRRHRTAFMILQRLSRGMFMLVWHVMMGAGGWDAFFLKRSGRPVLVLVETFVLYTLIWVS